MNPSSVAEVSTPPADEPVPLPVVLVDDNQLRARLAKKLLAMQADCGYIQKDKKNDNRGYGYASAEAVLKKVGPSMTAHGLASYPVYNIEATEERTTASGKAMQRITMACNLHVIDAETGFEIIAVGYGCGEDDQDKAPMKAQTSSLKCTWTSLLNISTGNDPEASHPDDAPAGPKPAPPIAEPRRASSAAPASAPREPGDEPPAAGSKHVCKCGLVAEFWEGDRNGRHLQGYFCPKPKNDKTRCDFKVWL